MAITKYKSGSQFVIKYADVTNDFPSVGVPIADVTTIGVKTPAGQTATVQFTMDSNDDIAAGDAVWLTSTAVVADSGSIIITEFGATGVKITASGGTVTAWIKS